ncbi:MAG TPA: response regulator, partial [Desulfobacterales bacterium]|nr:response regulator [Desulfobacterales bacterium]
AAEARQILGRSGFDLLFVDAVLPDGHGDELAEEEVQRRSATKILLTSGYPDQTRLQAALHRHGWPFLQKPYTMEGLLTAVARVLRQRPQERSE